MYIYFCMQCILLNTEYFFILLLCISSFSLRINNCRFIILCFDRIVQPTLSQDFNLTMVHFQARGIDIPMLDNVINYDFPAKPKLFVHRVGECSIRRQRYFVPCIT